MEVREAAVLLRARGVRVTAPRLAVLGALHDLPHTDVDTLTQAVVGRLGSLSKQAVYDILDAFVQAGLARRIQPAGGPARFETRTGDNHHHLVCRACGRTVDVDCAVGAAPCLEPSTDEAFVVDEAEVTFWGLCPTCQCAPQRLANQ
ncbi:MAG: transcriptional repressor [Nitriliruptorales bacterium]|nr:transcriptional repressor [Nitriliruptorales bacterium]